MTQSKPSPITSVLLVDDNEDDNFIHTRQILNAGLVADKSSVFVSWNGKEALDFLSDFEANKEKYKEGFPPALIFLDINMPVMNGFEFLDEYEALSRDHRYNSIVILMLTSSDNPRDYRKSEKYSCVKGYYSKPIDKAKLAEIVQKHFA